MKRVKRPELRLHGQKVRLKKKPVILAVSVLVLIVLLVSVSVHAGRTGQADSSPCGNKLPL